VKSAATILACSLVSIAYLSGCAVQKEWAATGGSRADGTVELAYEYGEFQEPEVDDTQGAELAASRCAVWGYTGSSAFGGVMRKCQAFGGYGNCLSWLVTRNYQCTGAPSSSNAPQTVQSVPAKPSNLVRVENQREAVSPPVTATTAQAAREASASTTSNTHPPVVNPNALTNKATSFENWDAH
jgi:YecR-like lipoprotein